MILLHTVEFFITIITFFAAYLVVSTGTNVFRAWVAYQMGDDTGVRLGFFSFNPLIHIDPVGVFCLLLFCCGWSRMVPIYAPNIESPYRLLKLVIAYFSDTIAHFIFSVIGIVMLLGIFDLNIVNVMFCMVLTHNVSHLLIANMYPDVSASLISVGFIVFAFVYLNVVLGVINLIINLSNYLLFVLSDYCQDISRYKCYITIGFPIVLILLFSPALRLLSVNLISYIGFFIANTFGIA